MQLRRAMGYAVNAVHVLRRQPSLLVVALLMASFSAVDEQVGAYVTYRRTAWGSQQIQGVRKMELARGRRTRNPVHGLPDDAVSALRMMVLSPGVPSVSLYGTIFVAWAFAYGERAPASSARTAEPEARMSPYMMLTPLILTLLSFAVGALVAGGYMGVARDAAATGRASWGRFIQYGKRVFWRFVALGVVDGVVVGVFAIFHFLPGFMRILSWGGPMAVMFFLNLGTFSVVEDNLSVVAALKRSVSTIRRDWVVAALLMVGAGAPSWLALRWYLMLRWRGLGHGVNWDPVVPLSLLPMNVLSHCIMCALSAWFCVAAFLWYRDARERRVCEK